MKGISCLLVTVFCLLPILAQAQSKQKGTLRLAISYYQQNEDMPVLKASAMTKTGKKFEVVEGIDINIFFMEETAAGFLGRVKTNSKGEVTVRLPSKFKPRWDSLTGFQFLATVTADDQFEDASAQVEVTKAKIELNLIEKDSTRVISAKVLERKDTGWTVVPDLEVKLVVRRMLSDLLASEEEFYTTDAEGQVSSPFSMTIPGDRRGILILGARIEDHEVYGNLLSTTSAAWGTPARSNDDFAKRTLFATRDKTPYWLLIFPNLMILGVWAVILFLVYLLLKIRKIGKLEQSIK